MRKLVWPNGRDCYRAAVRCIRVGRDSTVWCGEVPHPASPYQGALFTLDLERILLGPVDGDLGGYGDLS